MQRSGIQGRGQGQRCKFVNTDVWMAFTGMELEQPRLSRKEG